jgi:2-octaprenyl-6-methoxyphenol hydroxylase
VIDALPEDTRMAAEFDGRSYALALASVRMLGALGLWGTLEDNAQPMLEIKASDGRAGEGAAPQFLHFDHAEIEEGPMGHMLEDRHLRRALLSAMASQPLITHMPATKVVAQDTSRSAQVTLDDGRTLTARLLIGADGRRSGTAERAGILRTGLGLRANRAGLRHRARAAASRHRAPVLHARRTTRHSAPARQPVLHRLVGTHSRAAEIAAMDDDYLDALRPAFGDFLGEITLAGARYSYPLSLSIATAFVAPRLALVGDAAHGVHPIAGQGLNLGLRDVAALAEVLTDAGAGGRISQPPTCSPATKPGAASTPPRWPSPQTASTGCFQTTTRCYVPRATLAWAWSNPPPPCVAVSSARPPV